MSGFYSLFYQLHERCSFDDLTYHLIDIAYRCDCSRERTANMLRALDRATLTEMADEMPQIEVCCHFCNEKYVFTPDEVRQMAAEKKS